MTKNKFVFSSLLLSLSAIALGAAFFAPTSKSASADEYSSQKELGKYWMQVSASSSTSSKESHSIDVSFTTGYSSFSTERQTTVKTGVTKGGKITYSKDIDAPDTGDFDAFYYDGKDGAKAFSKMTTEELDELANSYRANYSSSVPAVYDGLIQNIDAKDEKNSICIVPRYIYSCDVGKDPYVSDTSSWSIQQKGTPIFETVYGDKIYCHDDVIFFGFNPEKISAKALEAKGASTFQEIYIPRNIKTIYSNSFFYDDVKPLSTCIFRLEATQEEINNPDNGYHYETGCFGTNSVSYGYENFSDYYDKVIDPTDETTYKATKSQRSAIRTTAYPAFGTGKEYDYNTDENMKGKNDYFIGYYPEDKSKEKPLIARFDVKVQMDGGPDVIKTLTYELPAPKNATYYAVGNEIYKIKNTISFDILYEGLTLDDGTAFDSGFMEIDPESVIIYNIYHAVLDKNNYYIPHEDPSAENPDYCGPLYCASTKKGGNLRISFDETIAFDSFLGIDFTGLTAFSGYTAINFNIKKTDKDIYKKLNPSVYKAYEAKINNGQAYIRYRVDSLKQASFRITLKDNSVPFDITVETPVKQFVIEGDQSAMCFLLKNSDVGHNFSASTVAKVDVIGFYVSIDIASNTSGPIGRTSVTTRFGAVNVMPYTVQASTFNADNFMIIFICVFTAAFIGIAIALYFVLKNKFKNDEFRRVNNKRYLKTSSLTYVCLTIVVLEILAIVFRCTLFNNAIVVFNPVDAYIIVFGILSILVIGYSIKFAVVQGKAIKARRMAKRLKLDEDVAQDGTN